MQLTWEFTSREKCVIGEVIYHCPGFQWSMRVGACGESQILLAATSPAGSALSKNMAGVYGVSSTFPNTLTDEIHLSLTSERTFFSLLLFGRTESDNKSLLFQVQSRFQGGNESEITVMASVGSSAWEGQHSCVQGALSDFFDFQRSSRAKIRVIPFISALLSAQAHCAVLPSR